MNLPIILSLGLALTPVCAFAQAESRTAGEATAEPQVHGSWRPRDVEPMEKGITPGMLIHRDGRFSITAQDGVQFHGTYTITNVEGKRVLTLFYKEPERTLVFNILKLDAKQLSLEKVPSKGITIHDRVEPVRVKNPLLSE